MLKQKRATLSVGIPAYNEERNIEALINTIIRQKQKNYTLDKIYVVCDGCTDNTTYIIKRLSKKIKELELVERPVRSGKVTALNTIYQLNKSDLILTIDADLVFANDDDINHMVNKIVSDVRINFVGPRHVPVPSKTLMGKFAVISYLSFEDAFLKINNGNNFYAVMGAYLLKKDFSKSIKYPKYAQADQVILYAMATRTSQYSPMGNKNGFKFVREAEVLFRTVSTFHDWRVLGVRSVISDKENTVKYFGKSILSEYYMPRKLLIISLIKWLFKSPFYTLGSILMNIYIRKYPLNDNMLKKGMWQTTASSKEAII